MGRRVHNQSNSLSLVAPKAFDLYRCPLMLLLFFFLDTDYMLVTHRVWGLLFLATGQYKMQTADHCFQD